MTDDDRAEPQGSHFSQLLQELELFARRPFDDEPDPRPLPEGRLVEGAAADTFDAMIACLGDTRLEPDLEDLLWGFTNVFHRAVERSNASWTAMNSVSVGCSASKTARRSGRSSSKPRSRKGAP